MESKSSKRIEKKHIIIIVTVLALIAMVITAHFFQSNKKKLEDYRKTYILSVNNISLDDYFQEDKQIIKEAKDRALKNIKSANNKGDIAKAAKQYQDETSIIPNKKTYKDIAIKQLLKEKNADERKALEAELNERLDVDSIKTKKEFTENLKDLKSDIEEKTGQSLGDIKIEDIKEEAKTVTKTENKKKVNNIVQNQSKNSKDSNNKSKPNNSSNNNSASKPVSKPSKPENKPTPSPSKPENKPVSKPEKKNGHWKTITKKVQVGEKKVVLSPRRYVERKYFYVQAICDVCGWNGTKYDCEHQYSYEEARTLAEEEVHKYILDTHRHGSQMGTFHYISPCVEGYWLEENSYMEPIFETRTEKVWVDN